MVALYHTCFICGQRCKCWSHRPKLTSSMISDVKPIIYIFLLKDNNCEGSFGAYDRYCSSTCCLLWELLAFWFARIYRYLDVFYPFAKSQVETVSPGRWTLCYQYLARGTFPYLVGLFQLKTENILALMGLNSDCFVRLTVKSYLQIILKLDFHTNSCPNHNACHLEPTCWSTPRWQTVCYRKSFFQRQMMYFSCTPCTLTVSKTALCWMESKAFA